MKTKKLDEYVNKVHTHLELITPQQARDLLQNNKFKNRDIRKNKIREMVADMINGNWLLTHQGICLSDKGNVIDGQNRLHAIIESEVSLFMNVSYNFPEESFSAMDKHSKRTTADSFNVANIKSYKSHAAGIRKYFQILPGESEYPSTHTRGKRPDNEMIDFVKENYDLCEFVRKISEKIYRENRILKESDSYAFMFYLIYAKNWPKEDVEDFMLQVAIFRPPRCNAPALLFKRLLEDQNSVGTLKEKIKWAFLIKTFIAWVDNTNLHFLRYTDGTESFPTIPEYN